MPPASAGLANENQPSVSPIEPQEGVLLKTGSPVTGLWAGDIRQGQPFFPPGTQPTPGGPEGFLVFAQACAQGTLAAPVLPWAGEHGTWVPGRDNGELSALRRFPHPPPTATATPLAPAIDTAQIDLGIRPGSVTGPWLTARFPPGRYVARDHPCGCGRPWARRGND